MKLLTPEIIPQKKDLLAARKRVIEDLNREEARLIKSINQLRDNLEKLKYA